MNVVIAIDPGKSGGVAVSAFGKTFCHPMPDTEGDRLELIRDFKRMADVECLPHGPRVDCICVLEQVGGFVGKGQPGSAMFKFGEGYGFLKGVVQALGIKLVRVRPQVWQKVFGLGTAASCASKTEWKNKLKAEAQRRFPDLNVTLKTADALLILEFYQLGAQGVTPPGEVRSQESESRNHLSPSLSPKGGEGDGAHGVTRPTTTIFRRDAEKDSRDGCANNNKETSAVTDRTLQTKEQNT